MKIMAIAHIAALELLLYILHKNIRNIIISFVCINKPNKIMIKILDFEI